MTQFTGIAVCKACTIDEAVQEAQYSDHAETFRQVGSITVSDQLFDELAADLQAYHAVWTQAKEMQEDTRGLTYVKVVTPTGRVIRVDTQGYDYARYTIHGS